MSEWEIRQGHVLDRLAELDAGSVQTCITSPPYFGLRDYGSAEQIGLEDTPAEYVARLVEVFREVRRVLRDDGTLWVNLGDTYNAYNGNRTSHGKISGSHRGHVDRPSGYGLVDHGLKNKDLMGIPWTVAFALRDDGWFLRSEIVWSKPNPMPESVIDRPTRSHEQIFLLSKRPRYYYDAEAIREEDKDWSTGGAAAGRNKRSVWEIATKPYPEAHFATFPEALVVPMVLAGSAPQACAECGAPWQRVVEREDQGYDGSRYGERAVEASGGALSGGTARSTLGSSNGKLTGQTRTVGWEATCEHKGQGGHSLVLDPFAGSGTTLKVAVERGRYALGIELNPEYVALAERRLVGITIPLFRE